MASPFQKYQSEQINQIPAGYVEAMGSMGKAYQQIGASIAGGIQEADKRSQEEAKIQGALAPYIKNDSRIQTVEGMIYEGTLVKKDDGTVGVAPQYEGVWDSSKAKPIIDFYNQTGGDGSKLTGTALTRFATELEAQQKYDSAQAAKEDAKLARAEMQAKIDKLRAEATEKLTTATGNRILGEFAADPFGSAVPASVPSGYSPQAQPGQPTQGQIVPANATGGITLGDIKSSMPSGYDVNRYNAGKPLATELNAASGEGVKPTAPAPAIQPAKNALTAVSIPTQQNTIEIIQTAEAERGRLLTDYNRKKDSLSASRSIRLQRAQAAGALTPEFSKSIDNTFKVESENLDAIHTANMNSVNERIKAATTVSAEGRAAAGETRSEAQLQLAKDADARAVEEGKMKKEEFNARWGQPVEKGKPAYTPTVTSTPGTWANKVDTKIANAGLIPGRMPGYESYKIQKEVKEEIKGMLIDYPAEWSSGLYHEGARQLQLDLRDNPTVKAISPGVQAKVQDEITGYIEAQSFLQQLNDLVESTDPGAVRNYFNRMLATATRDAKSNIITGDMMNQFGVAAFRRAIVSGGNFSDADREYVAKLITNINSLNPLKDKQLFLDQTQALAQFIDQKYRAGLSSYGINFNPKVSRSFLEREGDTDGLGRLSKTERYIRTFNIDSSNNTNIKTEELPGKLEALAANAEKNNNPDLAKQLRKDAQAQRDNFKTASEEAKRKEEASKK